MATQTERLDGYRERRNTYFKEHENSPLTPEQKEIFNGLSYFPENEDLHFTLEFDQLGEDVGEVVTFATVSGSEKQYTRAGRVFFAVDGQDATLSVFRNAT
ncbi:MAG TPA: DUF1684 domain-containing protein, partial [Thermomicrobiales bacterium]|nr:DUF1684 domain-containing protein [Thermomicrobiales bacterium]